jgi:hypothetical protein
VPLLYFVGSAIRDRGSEPVYDGFLWCVDPDDLLGPGGGPRDPEPVRFAAVGEPEEAETLARILNDVEAIKAQRDALASCLKNLWEWQKTCQELLPDGLAEQIQNALAGRSS